MSYFELIEGKKFLEIQSDLKVIQENLVSAYDSAKTLRDKLEEGEWEGEAQKAMTAFMELMLKYHGSLSGVSGNPVQEAADGVTACTQALENYYADSELYSELEKI